MAIFSFMYRVLMRFYPNVSFTLLPLLIIINNMEYFSDLFTATL